MTGPYIDARGITLPPPEPANLYVWASAALELEALAEIRERLLDVLKVPDKLLRVHVEVVPGRAPKCRASLQLTDAGLGLATALGARHVNRLIVQKALGHPDLSSVLHQGEDAESPEGSRTPPAVKREDRA